MHTHKNNNDNNNNSNEPDHRHRFVRHPGIYIRRPGAVNKKQNKNKNNNNNHNNNVKKQGVPCILGQGVEEMPLEGLERNLFHPHSPDAVEGRPSCLCAATLSHAAHSFMVGILIV